MRPIRFHQFAFYLIATFILSNVTVNAASRGLQANVQAPEYGLRHALVIANGDYQAGKLNNPVNDGRLIADALRQTGFKVTLLENAKRQTMLNAIARFGEQLDLGGTGLVYYAGHGLQVNGENWLIPVDANIRREEDVLNYGVNAQALLDRMIAAKNPLNLVLLDACRNNPYARQTRSLGGLARMDAGEGMLLAFATAPGRTADEGAQNSPFAQSLAKVIPAPGLKIEDALKQVRRDVRTLTQGKQITWDSSSLEGDFYFVPSGIAPASIAAQDEEVRLWDSINGNPAEYHLYLQRYPQGRFAELVRQRLGTKTVDPEKLKPAPEKLALTTFPNYRGVVTLNDLERDAELGERFTAISQRWGEFIAKPINELNRFIKDKEQSRPKAATFAESSAEAIRDIKNYPRLMSLVTDELFAFAREIPDLMQKKELDAAEQRITAAEKRLAYLEQLWKKEDQ